MFESPASLVFDAENRLHSSRQFWSLPWPADHAGCRRAGSNALLRRGEPRPPVTNGPTSGLCSYRATGGHHEVVISHGNRPQVGLLALQGSAYKEVDPSRWTCSAPRPKA